MKLYNYAEIKASGDCVRFAREVLGANVNNDGRCAASWRGGTNPGSVALTKDEWFDHAAGIGGSVIDLCAVAKFGNNSKTELQQAQEFLGDWLGLKPLPMRHAPDGGDSHYSKLLSAGYKEICRYNYRDENDVLVHQVVRMEHPDPKNKKQFVQWANGHWGLGDIEPILYNLKEIVNSPWIVMVEGEKDANTLIGMGIPATTVCGGTKKWNVKFRQYFAGKDIILISDNDHAGIAHMRMVAADVIRVVKNVKVIAPSKLPKGDITDYLTKEGGTWPQLAEVIKEMPALKPEDLRDANDQFAIEEAKAANKSEFRNFIPVETKVGQRSKTSKIPKQINDLIDDVHRRFLGFPRKVGEQMFDHDRDNGRIVYIHKQASLFAWVARKSKQKINWSREDGCVSKEELYEGILAEAKRYEAISQVPNWPNRSDVYYAHQQLPEPDPEHKFFEGFVNFFNPANDLYRVMLKTFITAPLFYRDDISRPLWIIDSEDGAGTGKTTIVNLVAKLYNCTPISTSATELKRNFGELIKRVVSSEGRQSRILMLDNITGMFSCPELADMVTQPRISGRPSYGRGEEVRPNNLTYVITANSANVDNDLASRAYYIMTRAPRFTATWGTDVLNYVEQFRFHILADIIDILSSHKPFLLPPTTRCPEFETTILQAHCKDSNEYCDVVKLLIEDKAETNSEEELARQIEENIKYNLLEVKANPLINPLKDKCFIRSEIVSKWISEAGIVSSQSAVLQTVRNLAKTGHLLMIDRKVRRYPHNGESRRSGVLWNPQGNSEIKVIGKLDNRTIGLVYGD